MRSAWSADSFAELHHRLIPVARRTRGQKLLRRYCELVLLRHAAKIAANGEETSKYPRNIAIERRQGCVVSDAEDRGGGVAADARERKRGVERLRKLPVMVAHNLSRG